MYYLLTDENTILSERYHPDTQVSDMNLWADFDPTTPSVGDCRRCPNCNEPISCLTWGEDRKGKLSNRRFPDVIFFMPGDDFIVSEHFKNEFQKGGFKGIYSFNEIKIVGKNIPNFKYYSVLVEYSDISWELEDNKPCFVNRFFKKKSVREQSSCTLCGRQIVNTQGILFDENDRRYDIFQSYSLNHNFWVSEQLAKWFTLHKFNNVFLVPSNVCSMKDNGNIVFPEKVFIEFK